jgi:hypothetical protein
MRAGSLGASTPQVTSMPDETGIPPTAWSQQGVSVTRYQTDSRMVSIHRSMDRLRTAVPRGRDLPPEVFRNRHLVVLWILAAHVPAVAVLGIARGYGVVHSVAEASIIAVLAIAAANAKASRAMRGSLAALGLVTCSAVLVHLSGGLIEMHFHFFVVLGLMTLYQDWAPYGVAFGYVVVHHGVMGALDPSAVYNHDAALNQPWAWALIHGGFVAAACIVQLFSWKVNELEHARAESFRQLVHDANLRRRQALQINDGIVQGLVVAQLAHASGRTDEAKEAMADALESAKGIISELVGEGVAPGAVEPGDLVHSSPLRPE